MIGSLPWGSGQIRSTSRIRFSAAAGVADADDETWSGVSGDVSEGILGYEHEAAEADSILIFYLDTATGLPVTPNSGDITVSWDNGANKIFKL